MGRPKKPMPLVYDNLTFNNFVKRMVNAEIKVQHYRGRFFYEGPAAVTSRKKDIYVDDVRKASRMRLQQDDMGLEKILYPVGSGKLIENNLETYYGEEDEN